MVKENKDLENQEQLIDQQVAESYYLENEAWQDISVAKSYGPARVFASCSSCSMVYGAGSYVTPCPRCGGRSVQSNTDESRHFDNSVPLTNYNGRYYCAVNNCPNRVDSQCGRCPSHSNYVKRCPSCSREISTYQSYCSQHIDNCSVASCQNRISSNQTYCFSHQVWQEQVVQNTTNSSGDYRKITIIYKRQW